MEAVFLKILNMSISASWLIGIVFVLRFLFKKAPKSFNYILWALVAIRLICPFTIESVLSLVPSAETVPTEIMYSRTPEVQTGIDAVDTVVNPIITGSMAPEIGPSINPMQVVMFVASIVWTIGIVVMLLYMVISYLMLRWKVRASMHLQENVWICDQIDSPFILGLIRPRIYLHSDIEEEQIAYIVAHEKEHLKYRDYLWKPLGFVILAIHWFNPLVWISYVYMCRDMEIACDERVIRGMDVDEKKKYSNVLLACSAKRRVISACPVAFGEVGIKQRIKSVVNYRKPAFWIVCVAVIACLVVGVCFLTNPKDASDSVLPEGIELSFEYKTDEPPCSSSVTLDTEKKQYRFSVHPLSSTMPYEGEYELKDHELTLKGSGMSKYVFYVVGDELVFDKDKSAKLPIYQYFPSGERVSYDAVPHGAVFQFKGNEEKVAIDFLTTLFTSNAERYQEYLTASGGRYTPHMRDKDFLDRDYNQNYIDSYSMYCTQNCMINMETGGLFTYLDYLANMVNSTVTVKKVKLMPKETEYEVEKTDSSAVRSKSYYGVITLNNVKNGKINEFDINVEIGLMDTDIYKSDGWKVSGVYLFDITSLSIHVTGDNIFRGEGGSEYMRQKPTTETTIITQKGEEKVRVHATQIINGIEYECGMEFPKKYVDEDKREQIKEHAEYYVNNTNTELTSGYIDWKSKDELYVCIMLFDRDVYEQTNDMDKALLNIIFYITDWDEL